MCCVVGSALMIGVLALARFVKRHVLHQELSHPEEWRLASAPDVVAPTR